MRQRIFKYLIYIVALPSIGFVSMFILKPVTAGAHDGGFLGMIFGLIIGQIIFTSWLTKFKWYYSIFIGFGLAVLTIFLSYWTIGTLRDIFNPVKEGSYFREPDENLESVLQWIFFLVLLVSSGAILELVNRFTTNRHQGHQ